MFKIFKEFVYSQYKVYNQAMYEFHPYFTNDGSVGLYSPDFDDIYHSATGALSEAYEKFILPVNMEYLLKSDSIKILDICYGIGYNSKCFLNYCLENYSNEISKIKRHNLKNFIKSYHHADKHIAQIDTDNIYSKAREISQDTKSIYNDKIYTNNSMDSNFSNYDESNKISNGSIYEHNILHKIYIKAVDSDKNLIYLSPFVKTGERNLKNRKINFNYNKIEKYLKNDKVIPKRSIDNAINYLLFEKIIQNNPEILENSEIFEILNSEEYKQYFSKELCAIYKFYLGSRYKSSCLCALPRLLHNIYYQYITNRYKRRLKSANLLDITFDVKIEDARKTIIEDNNIYNLIFLDAFTPSKCPCLWSFEFFKQLYNHLDNNGMLLTYSMSTSIRAAMIEAGFYIGNIFNERTNSYTGTVAVKNVNLIKYQLSQYDFGQLNTTGGIFYRDTNLTDQNEAITARRNLEIKNSNRISITKYKKHHQETI